MGNSYCLRENDYNQKFMKDTLIHALKISGKILLGYYNKTIETRIKESQSNIVTTADFESDSVITALIKEKYPAHNILSEESGYVNNNSEYTWIIDPLDGTSNFASGIPWFGVLITLLKENIPILGGAFLPVQDILYFAEKGKGAFRNGILLPKLDNKELKDSLFAFCVDYTEDLAFLNKGMEIYKHIVKSSRNIRCTNSLIDFIFVAEGKFGGVLNLYTKIWDISGLGLIIAEAGGIMLNIDGSEIDFPMSESIIKKNYPVVAGSKRIVESLKVYLISV
jgi:myo-inositol-1(or 4)-monophosphatase